MPLNIDIIRRLLIQVEKIPAGDIVKEQEFLNHYFAEFDDMIKDVELAEYIRVLNEAGLVDAVFNKRSIATNLESITRLTYQGHELLNKIRDDRYFDRIKNTLHNKGIGVSISTISKIADHLIEESLNS